MSRIKEAFLLDEIEIERKKSGVDYDEPEQVVKQFTGGTKISELDEYVTDRYGNGMFAY